MIKHIVVWTLKPSAQGRTADENAIEIKSRLEALRGCVPGLLLLEVGSRIGAANTADLVLYSEFTDEAALAAYAVHPEHVAAADFVNDCRIERTVIDYEVSSPSLM
jgi:hypothetical protein